MKKYSLHACNTTVLLLFWKGRLTIATTDTNEQLLVLYWLWGKQIIVVESDQSGTFTLRPDWPGARIWISSLTCLICRSCNFSSFPALMWLKWKQMFYLQRFCSRLDPEWSSSRATWSRLDTDRKRRGLLKSESINHRYHGNEDSPSASSAQNRPVIEKRWEK